MDSRRTRGGAVTPDPEPAPTVLHKYAWKAKDNTLVYADVKELKNFNDSTTAYLSPYTNETFNGDSLIMLFTGPSYMLYYGDKTQGISYSHEVTE